MWGLLEPTGRSIADSGPLGPARGPGRGTRGALPALAIRLDGRGEPDVPPLWEPLRVPPPAGAPGLSAPPAAAPPGPCGSASGSGPYPPARGVLVGGLCPSKLALSCWESGGRRGACVGVLGGRGLGVALVWQIERASAVHCQGGARGLRSLQPVLLPLEPVCL